MWADNSILNLLNYSSDNSYLNDHLIWKYRTSRISDAPKYPVHIPVLHFKEEMLKFCRDRQYDVWVRWSYGQPVRFLFVDSEEAMYFKLVWC